MSVNLIQFNFSHKSPNQKIIDLSTLSTFPTGVDHTLYNDVNDACNNYKTK